MPASPPRRSRLQDVAERAQVSKSIASRVLNGDPTVAVRDETRQRIFQAAQRLSYHPHPVAKALAGTERGAIALLVPELGNPAYTEIIRGAYRQARERGYVLLVAEDFSGQRADEAFTDLVEMGRLDGLLIASALPARRLLDALTRHWVPHVFVNRAVPGAIANVVLDVRQASELAADHLMGLGHRRIGHIGGPREVEAARRREDAFKTAVRARRGIPYVVDADFTEAGGHDALTQLLDAHPGVTALFASSFVQAAGALRAAAERGLDVPARLSVLAYEEVPAAAFTSPPLSTVALPLQPLGATAVDVLVEQIAGAKPKNSRVEVPIEARIVERASTGPPPG